MSIGSMRNRVVIQQYGGSKDAGGGKSVSYSDVGTRWASIVDNSGNEAVFGNQLRSTGRFTITIRNFPALTTLHRLKFVDNSVDRLFNIIDIKNMFEGQRYYMVITAEEGVAT
tara:strand:- start:1520 stop:1858 length:339 start_codon:yes stop_codon:yes gene_type:complete